MPEPWLRGTLTGVDPVRRQVLHALELTAEDVARWCAPLSDEELEARPLCLQPVAFHLRHIARSLDRLLTYAEGQQLSAAQLAELASEMEPSPGREALTMEFASAIDLSIQRILHLAPETFGEARWVGRKRIPTTVAGLLIHCAEHTQRHTGQLVTTTKVLQASGS